jgi:hypothetical protein
MAYQRKTPRQSPVSFYMGDKEKRLERLEKLDEIAAQFGVNRSVLIQKIADGELIVVRPSDAPSEAE